MTQAERTAHLLAIRNRMGKIISLSQGIRQEMQELETLYGIRILGVTQQGKYIQLSQGIELAAEAFGIQEPEITCNYFATKMGFLHQEYEIMQNAKATKSEFLHANWNGQAVHNLSMMGGNTHE